MAGWASPRTIRNLAATLVRYQARIAKISRDALMQQVGARGATVGVFRVAVCLQQIRRRRSAASVTACSTGSRSGLAKPELAAASEPRPSLTRPARAVTGLASRKGSGLCCLTASPLLTQRRNPLPPSTVRHQSSGQLVCYQPDRCKAYRHVGYTLRGRLAARSKAAAIACHIGLRAKSTSNGRTRDGWPSGHIPRSSSVSHV